MLEVNGMKAVEHSPEHPLNPVIAHDLRGPLSCAHNDSSWDEYEYLWLGFLGEHTKSPLLEEPIGIRANNAPAHRGYRRITENNI